MRGKKISYGIFASMILLLSITLPSIPTAAQQQYPTPRDQTLVLSIDPVGRKTNWQKFNPFIPGNPGVQGGSGWSYFVRELLRYPVMGTAALDQDRYAIFERDGWYWWLITDFTYNANYTSLTIYFRRGVEWNDGEPFTARDYEFTLNAKVNYTQLVGSLFANIVESVTCTDDYTCVISLKSSNPRAHQTLVDNFWLVAKHKWEGQNIETYDNWPPVETGPYVLQAVYPDQEMHVWVRNDNYWGRKFGFFPAVKYIICKPRPSPDIMLQEVISGDSDNYAGTTSLTIFQTLQRATTNVTATFYGEAGSTALRINTQSPYPLNMPEVRWAIQYAFNKQEMHNLWHRPPSLIPQDPFCLPVDIFASAFTKYLDEAEQASARLKADFGYEYKYDPEKAKQILDSLNFIDRDGDGIRETQNGTKLSFEVMFKEGLTDRLTSEILKESCQEVGIDIQFRLVDSAALESLTLLGQFEIWADSWGSNDEASRSDIFYRYYSFYSKNSNVSIGQQVLFSDRASRTRYWTPELDALLQQWQTLPDGNPALNDIIEQVFYLTGRDLSHIPVLYDRGLSVIYSTRYWYDFPSNVYQTNIQAADNYYITPAYWSSTCLQIVLQLKPVGVEYTSIWTAGNVSEFIGLDGKVYGPYVTGQYINNIPKEDADTLIASGKASLTQVIPGLESLEQSMQTLTGRAASLETSLSDVSNKVDNLGSQVNNVINYLTIGILGETVVLIILAVLLLSRRK